MDTQDRATSSMNDSGTGKEIGTQLTQPRSGFDLTYEDDRRALHHARNRIDAASPDGHTYSNILELRKNWELCRSGDFAEQHLPRLMLVQERRLVPRNKAMGE
jgi:hypothetical protein